MTVIDSQAQFEQDKLPILLPGMLKYQLSKTIVSRLLENSFVQNPFAVIWLFYDLARSNLANQIKLLQGL